MLPFISQSIIYYADSISVAEPRHDDAQVRRDLNIFNWSQCLILQHLTALLVFLVALGGCFGRGHTIASINQHADLLCIVLNEARVV